MNTLIVCLVLLVTIIAMLYLSTNTRRILTTHRPSRSGISRWGRLK